jgi:hypothetical protein
VITDVSVEVIFDLSLSRCCREQAIYESSLRAGHGWRESLYRHQGCFEASDCGRLGRQAAGHPWSALRVMKRCRKDCPNGLGAAEAEAAALHPKRYQSLLSKLSTREVGEAGKRSAGNRFGYQVIDRQAEDRQTGRNKADERWYPSRPCSVLNSGL